MLAYLLLILIFGLAFAMVSTLVAGGLALAGRWILRRASVETISLIASGVIPVLLMLVVAVSFFSDDRLGGLAAQGLLIIVGISFLATLVGWPLGFWFARRILVRRTR